MAEIKMDARRRSSPQTAERKSRISGCYGAIFFLILLILVVAIPNLCALQPQHPTQDDIEAAYLYNFGKFVRWPPDVIHKTLNICVLGKDPFGSTLDNIVANELIDGHALTVTRVADPTDAHSCEILFISRSESAQIEEDISLLNGLPIVTVSDMPDFVERGGMIQFVLDENRVRFEVNLKAADKNDLEVSSQLLKVAVRVIRNGPGKAGQ